MAAHYQGCRKIYKGALTYAAVQGPEFEQLRFWDALDYIGLNNYYPLPDDLSAASIVAKVEAVHRKYRKPVIFPEADSRALRRPIERLGMRPDGGCPWKTRRVVTRRSSMRFGAKPWFKGIYWWKIGTNGFGGPEDGSHTPWAKARDGSGQAVVHAIMNDPRRQLSC